VNERAEPRGVEIRTRLAAVVEFLLVSLLLAVSTPVIALACFLVRLTSRGSVLYTQERLGLGGGRFTIYKIRTMYQRSEPNGAVWSLPGDKRVTPVGRFLRWSHLDELPQLINVLRGEMSLVGPRPERPEIAAKLERVLPDHSRRLQVRPGLTGLAQVLRGPDSDLASVRQKLEIDLYYMDHRSLWMDLRIVLATVPHLLGVPPAIITSTFGFPLELIRPRDLPEISTLSPVNLPVSEACTTG
ncbi:MAG: sugar transferase, partial [Isosphaeraceae bacterium]